jgi:hypothetical protein
MQSSTTNGLLQQPESSHAHWLGVEAFAVSSSRGLVMVSPEANGAAKEDAFLREAPAPIHIVFPRKTRPASSPQWRPQRDDPAGANVESNSAAVPPLPDRPDGTGAKLIDKIKRATGPGVASQEVDLRPLSASELHRLYASTSVPEHRYLSRTLTESVNSLEIGAHPAKWLAGIKGIDLTKVVNAWLNTNGSTEYEQLYCIGLDPDTNLLTGVVKVKKGSGYCGGVCTSGSREYVAFWVDSGSGFQYQGTSSAAVYDFGWLPANGLEYHIFLPVDLLTQMQAQSEGATTVKVRAVLSWNIPPSTTDPNAPVVWGNSIEIRIPIPLSKRAHAGDRGEFSGFPSAGGLCFKRGLRLRPPKKEKELND